MKDSTQILRQKFTRFVLKKWEENNRYEYNIHCVYAIIKVNIYSKEIDIVYIGSTTCLRSRWKTHKVPDKIIDTNELAYLVYKKMDKGFYDYEMKLIKKLKPFFNKQHKK